MDVPKGGEVALNAQLWPRVWRRAPLAHRAAPSRAHAHRASGAPPLRRRGALGLCLGLWGLLAVGCGGRAVSPTLADDPARSAPDTLAPERALPAPGQFATAGLRTWGDPEGLGALDDELRLRAALQATLPPLPALNCLAREAAARFAVEALDADPGTLAAFARHCGLWQSPQRVLAFTAPDLERLLSALQGLQLETMDLPIGLGLAQHPDGQRTAALALMETDLLLAPVPKTRPDASGSVRLRGQILRGGPIGLWVQSAQEARRHTVTLDAEGRFDLDLPLPDGGPVALEWVRVTPHFEQTLGLLWIDAPERADYAPQRSGPRPTLEAIRAQIIEAVNGWRAAQGRPALGAAAQTTHALVDDWLGLVAANESSGPPEGITDASGQALARLRYGLAAGWDGAQVVELLAQSPSGQALLTAEAAEEIAVGLRPFAQGEGVDAALVLLRQLAPVDEALRAQLVARLDALRQAKGLEPLQVWPELSALVARTAEQLAQGALPWAQATEQIAQDLAKSGLKLQSYQIGGTSVPELEALDRLTAEIVLEPSAKRLGYGLALTRPHPQRLMHYIVLFVVSD